MNDESRPKAAPADAPQTVLRNPDLERWLAAAPLRGLFPQGLVDSFAEEVVARLDQHGDRMVVGRPPASLFGEVEQDALDIVGWLLSFVAYDLRATRLDLSIKEIDTLIRSAAYALYAARALRTSHEEQGA